MNLQNTEWNKQGTEEHMWDYSIYVKHKQIKLTHAIKIQRRAYSWREHKVCILYLNTKLVNK